MIRNFLPTLSLLSACALHPRYEPVLWPAPPPLHNDEVVPDLERLVERGLLPGIVANGDAVAPSALPDPIAWVVWWTAGRRDRGVELDLRVGELAVEVVRSMNGATRVAWAEAREPVGTAERTQVQARYSIAVVDGDRPWAPEEVVEVAAALAVLRPEELELASDVQLWRMAKSPRNPDDELAWYDPTVDPVRIEVYDQAFRDQASGFVGTPEKPFGPAASTVLHEMAHAIADAPIRRAYSAYTLLVVAGAHWADLDAAWRWFREVSAEDPVISAWKRVWEKPGPSTYGARSPAESFAEAFMLAHADPAALERVAPGAWRWLAMGGHVKAASIP